MYRSSAFSLVLFLSTVAAAQQVTVTKTTQSLTSDVVEISAVAVPMEQAGSVVIDYSTYHKEFHIGPEPETSTQFVEISAPATRINDQAPGNVTKGVTGSAADLPEKEIINISAPAQRVDPK